MNRLRGMQEAVDAIADATVLRSLTEYLNATAARFKQPVGAIANATAAHITLILRSLPKYLNATAILFKQCAEQLHEIKTTLQAIARFILHIWHNIRASAQWMYHFPYKILDFLTRAVQAVGRFAIFTTKIVLGSLTVFILLVITISLYRRIRPYYNTWRRKVHAQRAQDERERTSLLARERHDREARIQLERARKEKEARERIAREKAQRRQAETRADAEQYRRWRGECDGIFALSPRSVMRFPEPPCWPCDEVGCDSRHRHLEGCEHSLQRLYRAAGGDLRTILRKERIRWHPDWLAASRFAPLRRSGGVEKALELSQIVGQMLDALDGE